MRHLVFLAPGQFAWRETPAPRLQADTDAIVAPVAVARCDLDLYIALGIVKYPGPFAFGHECIARVVEAGDKVAIQPGELVVVPFQLSCGRCTRCQRGWTNACEAYPLGAAFGLAPTSGTDFGGALADLMRVPFADHMLVRLASGIDPIAAASLSDNIADGWRAVAGPLQERPGANVLVLGGLAQSVSLYAAGAAVALGAGRVLYLDDQPERRALARALGAVSEPLALDDGRTPDEQFEIVVEGTGHEAALAFAVRACGINGIVTSVAIHLGATTPLPLTRAYYKGLTLRTSRVHSRATFPDAMNCMACGALHPEHVTHRIARFSEAGEAMADAGPKLIFLPE